MKNLHKIRERNLLQCLADDGILTQEQVESVKESTADPEETVVETVLRNQYAGEHELAKSLVFNYQLPFIYPEDYTVNPEATALLDGKFAHARQLLPLDLFGDTLVVLTSGNLNEKVIREVEEITGKEVYFLVTLHSSLEKKLEEVYPKDQLAAEVKNRMDELFGGG